MKLKILHLLLLAIGLLIYPSTIKAQRLAIKTDATKLALMSPNLGFELIAGKKATVDISIFGNYKPWGKNMKMLGFQPEYRYWFNGRRMVREYVGFALLATTYDITWNKHIYKGDAAGGGLTFGYVLPLSQRTNIEFYGGFGIIGYWQKQYYINDNYEDYEVGSGSKNNSTGYTLLPTKIGVAFSYILK